MWTKLIEVLRLSAAPPSNVIGKGLVLRAQDQGIEFCRWRQ